MLSSSSSGSRRVGSVCASDARITIKRGVVLKNGKQVKPLLKNGLVKNEGKALPANKSLSLNKSLASAKTASSASSAKMPVSKSVASARSAVAKTGLFRQVEVKSVAMRAVSVKMAVVNGRGIGQDDIAGKPLMKQPILKAAPAKEVSKPQTFKEGDKIVYPGHGVGIINLLQRRIIGGEEHQIFDITIVESGMKVTVPVAQANAVGIRKVIDKKAVDKVFAILKDRNFKIDTQTWNRRFREYSQKIKTGSPFEIAEVLRDLSVLSVDKQLSFGEKKMLDVAQGLLVSEISIARSKPADKVMGDIRALFT